MFSVTLLDPASLLSDEDFISRYRYKRFSYYSAFTSEALTSYFLNDLTSLIRRPDAAGLKLASNGRSFGLVFCQKAPWESEVLGIEAGTIGPIIVDETTDCSDEVSRKL